MFCVQLVGNFQAYQLPRQDLALAYCRYVEPQNHTSYQDFVAARNDIALDIAYVKELKDGGARNTVRILTARWRTPKRREI